MEALSAAILNILKTKSTKQTPLTQKKIMEHLEQEYDLSCNERALSARLKALKELAKKHSASSEEGQDPFSISERRGQGVYFVRKNAFAGRELRALINGLRGSHILGKEETDRVLTKLGLLLSAQEKKDAEWDALIRHAPTANTESITLSIIEDAVEQVKKELHTATVIAEQTDKVRSGWTTLYLKADAKEVFSWALLHANVIVVEAPSSLRNKLRRESHQINATYSKKDTDYNAMLCDLLAEHDPKKRRDMQGGGLVPRISIRDTALLRMISERKLEDRVTRLVLDDTGCNFYSLAQAYKNVKEVAIADKHIEDLAFLPIWHQLASLRIRVMSPIAKTDPFVACKNLQFLIIEHSSLTDGTFLSELKNLIQLELGDSHLQSLDFLSALPNLRKLRLGKHEITDFSSIYSHPALEELVVDSETNKRLDLDRFAQNRTVTVRVCDSRTKHDSLNRSLADIVKRP